LPSGQAEQKSCARLIAAPPERQLHDRGDPGLRLGLVDLVALLEARVLERLLDGLHDVPGSDTGVLDQP
jgi:hypothetical protein